MTNKLRFVITRDSFSFARSFQFRAAGMTTNGKLAIMQPVQFKVEEADGVERPPAMSMSIDDCQSLMDELWNVGVRPTEGSGSAGSLAATQRHLEDMRALVFKTGAPK